MFKSSVWKKILVLVSFCLFCFVVWDYVRTKINRNKLEGTVTKLQASLDSMRSAVQLPQVPQQESEAAEDQKPDSLIKTVSDTKEAAPLAPVLQAPIVEAPNSAPAPSPAPAVSSLPLNSYSGIPASPIYGSVENERMARQREEFLVSQMFSSHVPVEARKGFIQELGSYPYFRVARALSQILQKDQSTELRSEAARSLGKTGNMSFAPVLDQAVKSDPDPSVKEAASAALAEIMARASSPSL